MKVVITKHAVDRVVQRFRLFMFAHEIDDPKRFLMREYNNAYVDMRLELCPFYKNKLAWTHGAGSFFAHSKNLTFMCTNIDNVITIRTVVKRREDWNAFRF